MDKLMTFEEAAERLGTTLGTWAGCHRAPHRLPQAGPLRRFHPDDLAEYVAAHRVEANQYPEVG